MEEMMLRIVFGQVEIDAWNELLNNRRPKQIGEMEVDELPQIEAFSPATLDVGMAFRFAARDGSEYAFLINPVAARHLAACILRMGQEAGWLDEAANVICPPVPRLDA
jgi:hypothetical protein